MSKHYQESKYHDLVHQVFEWLCWIGAVVCAVSRVWIDDDRLIWTAIVLMIAAGMSSHTDKDEDE